MNELNVKVGDKVLLSGGYGINKHEKIATVERITPTGRIKVSGSTSYFNKYGDEMRKSDSWALKYYLKIPTPEDFKRIEERDFIRRALRIVEKFELSMTLEQAKKIIEAFGGEA